MPAKLISGDTWFRTWKLTDPAGVAINLTGATARLHVRDADDVKVMEASTVDGRITITPLTGQIDLVMPHSVTALAEGKYQFNLEVTHADNTRRTYESDFLTIVGDTTRDLCSQGCRLGSDHQRGGRPG